MASNTFGVTPSGFIRPTLAQLIEQEMAAMRVGVPSLTFAAGSPELSIAEARAKVSEEDWASRECQFNSFDTSSQTGCALDIAAKLQGFTRLDGESDTDFQSRISSTENGDAFVTTLERSISALPDVCRVRVFNNTTTAVSPTTGNPAGSFEVVYQGGDAEQIALQTWLCSTGAINAGQDLVPVEDAEGICREVNITQAAEVPYCVRLTVDTYEQRGGCSNQTNESIITAAFTALSSKSIGMGDPIHAGVLSAPVLAAVGGIDIRNIEFAPSLVDAEGNCTCEGVTDWESGALTLSHRSLATFDRDCIEVNSRDL